MTATQRRSVRRHAKLVDYEPSPGAGRDHDAAVRRRRRRHPDPARAGGDRPRRRRHADHVRDRASACATPPPPPPASALWNRAARASAPTGSTTPSSACRPARPRCSCPGCGYGFRRRPDAADRDPGRRPRRSAGAPDRASAVSERRARTSDDLVPAGAGQHRRSAVHDLPDLAARARWRRPR